MGLDMTISRTIHGYRKSTGTLSSSFEDYKTDEYGCSNSEYVTTQAAYWRKANSIHKWFVDNVQNGEDDCGTYEISIDTLRKLRAVCVRVLDKMRGMALEVPDKYAADFKKFFPNGEVPQKVVIDPDNLSELAKVTVYHELPKDADIGVCETILPTQSGFFFGDTKYNGNYIQDIANTVRMLDRIFTQNKKLSKKGFFPTYEYHASW